MSVPQPIFNWPIDEDGKPMDMVSYSCTEKIGLPNYSNVDVGPATIVRFTKQNDANARGKLMNEVEAMLREQRQIILDLVKGKK